MGPFRIALSGRRSSVGTCRRFLSRRRIPGADGMAVLLYVQRDAYDTETGNVEISDRSRGVLLACLHH